MCKKLSIWFTLFRPHGDPQMMRFGAHLVLVLRYLLADEVRDTFKERIMTVGDLILNMLDNLPLICLLFS